jgi:hypothetical protein
MERSERQRRPSLRSHSEPQRASSAAKPRKRHSVFYSLRSTHVNKRKTLAKLRIFRSFF